MATTMPTLTAVEQFLFLEARLLDDADYAGWEALWTDDAIYWVPAADSSGDPDSTMSLIHDSRSRIALRVRQLETGRRYAQHPPSRTVHVISNIELLQDDGADIDVAAVAVVYESNQRGETVWASRNRYRLRRDGESLRLARKTVDLVNRDKPLFTLAFLI